MLGKSRLARRLCKLERREGVEPALATDADADERIDVIIAGYALVQKVRRGCYELALEEFVNRRLVLAFDQLAVAI